MTSIEVQKDDLTDEEMDKLQQELQKNIPKEQQSKQPKKPTPQLQSTDIIRTKAGVQPVSESDETHRNLKILSDDEQAAVRKANLDRKTSYYHFESMKKYHVIPIRISIDYEKKEELWEEKKFEHHELVFEQEDKLEELRASMDDLEKQTFVFNRQRAILDDKEYNVVKRKWHLAKREWAFFAARAFLWMTDDEINNCKSTTLRNVIEACEYRSAITVPYSRKTSQSGLEDLK